MCEDFVLIHVVNFVNLYVNLYVKGLKFLQSKSK